MLRDHACASEAQGDPGAAVTVIVDQEFRSRPARKRHLLELEAHTTLAVGADTYDVRIPMPQHGKVGIGKDLAAAQRNGIGIGSLCKCSAKDGGRVQLRHDNCCRSQHGASTETCCHSPKLRYCTCGIPVLASIMNTLSDGAEDESH